MAEANNGSVKTRARRADVAREAGVSASTVSRVINNKRAVARISSLFLRPISPMPISST